MQKKNNQELDLSFEEAMKELEDITKKLESGSLSLDESIKMFEKGHMLKAHCEKLLDTAKLKVEKIISSSEKVAFNAASDL